MSPQPKPGDRVFSQVMRWHQATGSVPSGWMGYAIDVLLLFTALIQMQSRQSEKTSLTDQNGNVRQFDHDDLGRPAQDRVTTLGTGADERVRRIEQGFDVRGNLARITSFDNATVGSGNVVNELTFEFNDFNQSIDTGQSHAGAVDPASTPSVATSYADGEEKGSGLFTARLKVAKLCGCPVTNALMRRMRSTMP